MIKSYTFVLGHIRLYQVYAYDSQYAIDCFARDSIFYKLPRLTLLDLIIRRSRGGLQ